MNIRETIGKQVKTSEITLVKTTLLVGFPAMGEDL